MTTARSIPLLTGPWQLEAALATDRCAVAWDVWEFRLSFFDLRDGWVGYVRGGPATMTKEVVP